ncbi:MAG: PP2C family protein-serine/threonine phosphatase [Acidobacteriota bacterium]
MRAGDTDGAAARHRLRDVLFKDVRPGDIPRAFSRDLKEIYRFYLDEEARARLAAMGRARRAIKILAWILKSLLLRLSPVRRLMLVAALLMFLLPSVTIGTGEVSLSLPDLNAWGFLLLLLVLMLELKDKLLARDEIVVARRVQRALLPRGHPAVRGWALWSHTRPANVVGGDLVDYIALERNSVGVALGDVAGKGLGAALLMAKLQATLRALAPARESLVDLGRSLNDILHRDGLDNRYATLFYLRIDADEGRVRYLNAGHNPPIVVGAHGLQELPASSRPLGMLPGQEYGEGRVELEPGDLLVAYSDGVVEARGPDREEFGAERLRALLPRLRGLSVGKAGALLLEEIDRYLAGERPGDDLSLILALRGGPSAPEAA